MEKTEKIAYAALIFAVLGWVMPAQELFSGWTVSSDLDTGKFNVSTNNIKIGASTLVIDNTTKTYRLNNVTNYTNGTTAYKPNDPIFAYILNNAGAASPLNLVTFQDIVAPGNAIGNYFYARAALGNYNPDTGQASNVSGLPSEFVILAFAVSGWDNSTNGWSGSKANFNFVTNGTWNVTEHPTRIDIKTNPKGAYAPAQTVMQIQDNGQLRFNTMTGSGYAFLCLDSAGNTVRSSVSCNLI